MSFRNLPLDERIELGRRLTERQLLIYIYRLGGYSWEQIADITHLQIRTVRTHYNAARRHHQQIQHDEEAAA